MQIVIEIRKYEDEYMATSTTFDGLSTFGDTPEDALKEFASVMKMAIEIMIEDGEDIDFNIK